MIIARDNEILRLRNALASDRSEFVAIYGRRRVGKTYLVREALSKNIFFQHAGIAEEDKETQLFSFCASLKNIGFEAKKQPRNWMEAFELLKDAIRINRRKKKVIFLDELSWMYTQGCDLIPALESFWNGWASARKDIMLIVCASATSWMMKNIIHAYGGLHHRLSDIIGLRPFNLKECELFSEAYNLSLPRDQIIEAYMVLGGVPYYWSLMKKELSLPQNIDFIFFSPEAPLKNEYRYLYASLFKKPEPYMRVIEILSTKKLGLTRDEIKANLEKEWGGKLTQILKDLEDCDFIRSYIPFGKKKKGGLFQLMDFFTLYHFAFLNRRITDRHYWSHKYTSAKINTWRGLAFERVCLWHSQQIINALGVSGIETQVCSWQCQENQNKGIKGAQIDLIIDRDDKKVSLCEMKFSSDEYTMSKKDEESMRTKESSFRKSTKTKKGIHLTLVSPYGVTRNIHSAIFHSVITAEHLFVE